MFPFPKSLLLNYRDFVISIPPILLFLKCKKIFVIYFIEFVIFDIGKSRVSAYQY